MHQKLIGSPAGNLERRIFISLTFLILFFGFNSAHGQKTQIKGFAEVVTTVDDGKLSFGIGEQDLFITSEISNRLSFLGETVFKFSPSSPTKFNVSIERIILKYNYKGNHNLLVGKHHTPINYWNDTYHHGRVFFPTINRPLLFQEHIIPIHTTGVSLQGLNLGKLKFGYDFMIGNGLGSSDVLDNDKYKSITAAVHIKPKDGLRIGASYYHDVISEGAEIHGQIVNTRINQSLISGSVAYFGKKFELLAESTFAINSNDSTGNPLTVASYAYAGIKLKKKWVPYIRVDILNYQPEEILFEADNTTSFVGGLRYEINFLAVVKLEYQYEHREIAGNENRVTAQFAIGF